MTKMYLFVDWDEEGEEAGWQQSVTLPLERFQFDDKFADFVSTYISQQLEHLAEEVELIAQHYGKRVERDDACE